MSTCQWCQNKATLTETISVLMGDNTRELQTVQACDVHRTRGEQKLEDWKTWSAIPVTKKSKR